MNKYFLIVDWLLIIIFVFMVTSKFITLPFAKLIQPVFLILIFIHTIQHWKVIVYSLKGLKKK